MTAKEVMKKAVALARTFTGDWIARMALALKTIWSQAKSTVANEKGSIQLKGTEKQVKWASEARDAVISYFEQASAEYINGYKAERPEEFAKRELKIANTFQFVSENILSNDDAKFWIDHFGYNYKEGFFAMRTLCEVFKGMEKDKKKYSATHVEALENCVRSDS